ncbi:MAG: hypothetical protein FJX22_04355 [Alphaproteobacteria bacterium]|nr:hypothetical protein [Alphaproteobacteria bacterium]
MLLGEFISNYNTIIKQCPEYSNLENRRTISLSSEFAFAKPLQFISRVITPIIPITNQSKPLIMPNQVDDFLSNPQWGLNFIGGSPTSIEFLLR